MDHHHQQNFLVLRYDMQKSPTPNVRAEGVIFFIGTCIQLKMVLTDYRRFNISEIYKYGYTAYPSKTGIFASFLLSYLGGGIENCLSF